MEVLEAIFNRRSIRQYTTREIPEDMLITVIKAGMYAPSAVNKQPWHFVIIRNRETMHSIMAFHPNASMLDEANAAILICWDEKLQHDMGYGPVDCSAATQNMLLAAHSLGLGSVWVGIYPRAQRMEAIHSLFELPDHIKPHAIVSLGFPAEDKAMPIRFRQERIHVEKW